MENQHKIVKEALRKNGISDSGKIIKFESGQINHVYAIDGKYVIKIEGELEFARGIFKHQSGITEKLLGAGVKVPKILNEGTIEGKGYLLMEKVRGGSMIYDWPKLSEFQREAVIVQLAEQLRRIHSIKFDSYSIPIYSGRKFPSLLGAVAGSLNFSKINKPGLKKEYGETVEFLKRFYEENKHVLGETDTAVLVHNDMHWENIFYDNEELTGIIDWDWASQASRDYELWRLIEFCYSPVRFVGKKLEPLYEKYRMVDEIGTLRKHYPELFSSQNLGTRIRLFLLDTLVNIVVDYQSGRWDEKALKELNKHVDGLYKSNWLEEILN